VRVREKGLISEKTRIGEESTGDVTKGKGPKKKTGVGGERRGGAMVK